MIIGFEVPLGDEVVEDEVGMALLDPARLIFAAAVLKIKHRIAHLDLRVVTGRQVKDGMPPTAGDLGEIPDLPHGAVGNILRQIVVCPWFGNLNATCVSAASVEGMASRIVHVHSVDDEVVVMETGDKRRSSGRPEPVGALHHVEFRIAPEIELYRRGARGLDAELGSAAGVDARVFRAPHIRGSGLETVSGLRVAVARKQKYRDRKSLHRIVSLTQSVPEFKPLGLPHLQPGREAFTEMIPANPLIPQKPLVSGQRPCYRTEILEG